MPRIRPSTAFACLALAVAPATLSAQSAGSAVLRIDAGKVAAHVSPKLYGLMTEEINFSYDGGLYFGVTGDYDGAENTDQSQLQDLSNSTSAPACSLGSRS